MRIHGAVLRSIATRPFRDTLPLAVEELELDDPGPRELLVQVEAAGLCHSDLSVVDGTRPRPLPMLLGHEAAGRVLAVGEQVSRARPGDRVVMTFLPRCGECAACRSSRYAPCLPGSAANAAGTLLSGERRLRLHGAPVNHHLGVSGFATHAVVDERSVVPVPDDVPPDVAAVLGCAVLTGGGAVVNAGDPEPGEDIVVVGLGGVGMAALITAISLGLGRVVAVDPVRGKRDHALRLGATAALDPEQAMTERVRAPLVVEAAGSARAFTTGLELVAPGGRLVTVGLPAPHATVPLAPLDLVASAKTVIGCYLGSAVAERDIPGFVRMWRAGFLPIEALISHEVPLDRLNQGMDALAEGAAIRQIVRLTPTPSRPPVAAGAAPSSGSPDAGLPDPLPPTRLTDPKEDASVR